MPELQHLRSELRRTKKENKRLKKLCAELEDQKESLRRDRDTWQMQYSIVANSTVWKMTKPIRWMLDIIKRIAKKIPPVRLLVKFIRSLRANGWRATMHKVKR